MPSLYYVGPIERIEAILQNGFSDETCRGVRLREDGDIEVLCGVWLTENSAYGMTEHNDTALAVEISEELTSRYELPEEKKQSRWRSMPIREFVVPSKVLNEQEPRVVDHRLAGMSADRILYDALTFDEFGNTYIGNEWRRRRDRVIPFLERHQLLSKEPEPDLKPEAESSGDRHRGCGNCCMHSGAPPFCYDKPPAPPLSEQLPPHVFADFEANCRRLRNGDSHETMIVRLHGEPCFWFDLETRTCKYYEFRPRVCRLHDCGGKDSREA